jgi:hypothetical protein
MSESFNGVEPYRPRSGESIDAYVDILSREPEHPLSEDEKNQFYKFREELLFGQIVLNDGTELKARQHGEVESLDEVIDGIRYSEYKHEICIDYFMTEEGRRLLADNGLLEPFGVDEVQTAKQIRSGFMKHSFGMNHEIIEKIADASKVATDDALATQIASGEVPTPPERLFVFEDATNLVRRVEGLSAYRRFFRDSLSGLRREYEEDPSNLAGAKKAIAEIYLKQVNGELAAAYPDVFVFLEQVQAFDDQKKKDLIFDSFARLLPGIVKGGVDVSIKKRGRFMVRLDRIRNGASRDEDGRFTAVSPELEEYLSEQNDTERTNFDAEFTSEEVEILDGVKYDAKQMQELAKTILEHFDMLSIYPESDFKRDRPRRAPDGKWQVVISDDITAMTAEDPQGGFEIPAKFKRSLTKPTAPVGVIPGVAHEIQHAIQQDNTKNSPGGKGIGKTIFGRRNDAFFEAGAIHVEQVLQERLFGRQRSDSPHYLRALVAVERGANEVEAVKVFYESYAAANPNETPIAAARVAVSRVMRLVRRYGGYNSQPLNYSESGLLLKKTDRLPEKVRSLLFDNGSLEIEDLARLHEFDLLPKDTKSFPYDEFVAIVTPVLRRHIQDARIGQ